MHSQIESGFELLARLSSKPSLRELEKTLFVEEPRNTDIVEISGEQSTGKTLLVSQILVKCILPNYYKKTRIGGYDSSAILINTDHHFQISKLVQLMINIIDLASTGLDKAAIIENSLRNLHIISCYNNEQFSLTLRTLDNIFFDNGKIVLLAIDSITAYYWQHCEDNNIITIDTYVKDLIKIIRTHTTLFNVMTIYTRFRESTSTKEKKYHSNVDYKVQLYKSLNPQHLNHFVCAVETTKIKKQIHYSIVSNGIKWKLDERET